MRQVGNGSSGKIMAVIIQHQRDCAKVRYQPVITFGLLRAGLGSRGNDIIGIFQKIRGRSGKSGLFRAGHRMPADKTAFQAELCDSTVDIAFYAAGICDDCMRRNPVFQLAQVSQVLLYRGT